LLFDIFVHITEKFISRWSVLVQVSGYVLLAFIYNVDVIPLTNLRVIRGNTLFQVPNDPTNHGYSLYVSNNYLKSAPGVGLKELQLTSLHGMMLSRYCFFINCVCNYLHAVLMSQPVMQRMYLVRWQRLLPPLL